MVNSAVHSRRGFRGLGQNGAVDGGSTYYNPTQVFGVGIADPGFVNYDPSPTGSDPASAPGSVSAWWNATFGSGSGSSAPPSSSPWSNPSLLATAINQIGSTVRTAIFPQSALPPGSVYTTSPYGTTITTGGAASTAALTSSLTGMLPILLLVGGVVLVISMVKR
jgi:hypothetical protein